MKKVLSLSLFAVTLVTALCLTSASHADPARVLIVAKVIDVASLADAAGSTSTVTVPGAALGDACIASSTVDMAGITMTCYVSAANTASIRFQNESGGTLDLASATYRIYLFPKGTR